LLIPHEKCKQRLFLLSFRRVVGLAWLYTELHLVPTRARLLSIAAMSNQRPGLGFRCRKVSYILTACPYFDNLEFDIFYAVGFQCLFITLLPLQLGFECFQYISLS